MQTLKPCPFCNGSAEIVQDSESFFARCENSACPPAPQTPLVDDADTAAIDWNTRPTAPVEGLERYDLEDQSQFNEGCYMRPDETGEYVRFDQAEAIIAAERNRAEVAEYKLDQAVNTVQPMIIQRAERAEADNAALTATMERLRDSSEPMACDPDEWTATEEVLAHLLINVIGVPDDVTYTPNEAQEIIERQLKQSEALETQLAAAKKAARAAHDTLIEINPSNYNHDDVCQMNDASIEAIFLLADVLGETHGKTAEWWKLRRAARAALEAKP